MEEQLWERIWVWHALLAAMVVVSTGIAQSDTRMSGSDRLLVLGLSVAVLVWHWLMMARRPEWWLRPLPMTVYWVGMTGLVLALVTLHQHHSVMLYALYPLMFVTLGWWAMLPVAGVTGFVAWTLAGPAAPRGVLLSVLSSTAVALLIALFVNALVKQHERLREARAELAETARRAGVLEERERLARELHDTVAQSFTSIVTQLEAADQAFDGRAEDAREHVVTARTTARDGLDEVRRSVQALRPDLLEEASLPQALERTLLWWSAASGVRAELRTTGDVTALHPETETALLRVTQEALTNVARHADANRVIVSLSYLGDTVTLDVDDDGAGTTVAREGGFGLVGMRERIAGVGGALIIESEPGQGTTIAASVPS
ncbi:sensor histidine kinase [Allokutzneria sp. A3M-2-11 16]|uniref:sensor histidine kinase n=1 Tax=Allokutzneria sp. A3M-2-11 16 TaxID=2962043 RepID=UPI0020B68BFE|nr:sensor histidine kinase [Allokutzneria sp. A3M-2-11 16]MCP3804876.1 sensor histidine kinase [Allokutzneria sp. A3M-2-11 16]